MLEIVVKTENGERHVRVSPGALADLPAAWDRDPGRAITVTPLDWRRRLIG